MGKLPKTTEIVDRCIKEFFEKGKTILYQRTELGENNKELNESTFAVFLRRMNSEHPGTKYSYKNHFAFGIDHYVIEKL